MIVITTPISMIPPVDPISETPPAAGVGVVCRIVNEDGGVCAGAKDWLKFALVNTKINSKNMKASPKI